jgi:hypothetical protein
VVARTRATNRRLLASTTTPPMISTAASVPAAAENQRYASSGMPIALVHRSGINTPMMCPAMAANVP